MQFLFLLVVQQQLVSNIPLSCLEIQKKEMGFLIQLVIQAATEHLYW